MNIKKNGGIKMKKDKFIYKVEYWEEEEYISKLSEEKILENSIQNQYFETPLIKVNIGYFNDFGECVESITKDYPCVIVKKYPLGKPFHQWNVYKEWVFSYGEMINESLCEFKNENYENIFEGRDKPRFQRGDIVVVLNENYSQYGIVLETPPSKDLERNFTYDYYDDSYVVLTNIPNNEEDVDLYLYSHRHPQTSDVTNYENVPKIVEDKLKELYNRVVEKIKKN